MQLFEFLSTIVSSRRLAKVWLNLFSFLLHFGRMLLWFLTQISSFQVLASNVRELVYQTVAFLQVTEQQVRINHASSTYSNIIRYSGYILSLKSVMTTIPAVICLNLKTALFNPELAQIQGVVASYVIPFHYIRSLKIVHNLLLLFVLC